MKKLLGIMKAGTQGGAFGFEYHTKLKIGFAGGLVDLAFHYLFLPAFAFGVLMTFRVLVMDFFLRRSPLDVVGGVWFYGPMIVWFSVIAFVLNHYPSCSLTCKNQGLGNRC